MKKLDTKTLQRLETAVAKSEYSQGKKLKVVTKVGDPEEEEKTFNCRTKYTVGQPGYNGRLGC